MNTGKKNNFDLKFVWSFQMKSVGELKICTLLYT